MRFLKTSRPSKADFSEENNVDRILGGMDMQIKAMRLPSELHTSKEAGPGMMDIGIQRKVSEHLTPQG
jgi:hypothetical protein